jgi:hypothetical protein
MDLNEKKPEDVLKPEFVQQYKEHHEDIWQRLIQINTNITILEIIQKFPFHYIYYPPENVFWESIYWNFLYISIAFIHSLTTDQGDQKHTLPRFKNKVLAWLKDSEKKSYRKKLRTAKLDKNLQEIRSKIVDMRNNIIAHRFLSHKEEWGVRDVEGLTVPEIRKAYNDAEKLFHVCSFGSEYITTFYPMGTCGGKPIEKDIDHLLDLIVKDSFWLNQPERRKQYWQVERQHLSEEELQELNNWRKKFGLPLA